MRLLSLSLLSVLISASAFAGNYERVLDLYEKGKSPDFSSFEGIQVGRCFDRASGHPRAFAVRISSDREIGGPIAQGIFYAQPVAWQINYAPNYADTLSLSDLRSEWINRTSPEEIQNDRANDAAFFQALGHAISRMSIRQSGKNLVFVDNGSEGLVCYTFLKR